MEQYGRAGDGSQSDPSPEWTGSGGETGLEGECAYLRILNWFQIFGSVTLICGFSRMWSLISWV